MPLFSRKSKSAIAAPVTQPHRGRPFDLMPPSFSPYAGSRLYYMLRQAVPLIDAAVMKTVRLTGGFDVRCADPAAQSYLDRVLREKAAMSMPCDCNCSTCHAECSSREETK